MQIWNLREVMDYQGFVTKTDISMQYDLFTQETPQLQSILKQLSLQCIVVVEVSLRSYVLIDPLASEQQHSYCTGWKVNNGSHGLTGDASSILKKILMDGEYSGTGCGGYFTLFFKEPIDMSGITKIRWKYDMGDECGSRSVTFRSVNTGPSISGTYVLADENDWAKLSGIQEATNYKKVGYIQKFGENRICQNQDKKGNRRPISSKMPLSLYNFVDEETGEEPLFLKTNSLADQIPRCCRDYDNTIMTYGDGIEIILLVV